MDLTWSPAEHAFRGEARAWLEANVPDAPLASGDTREGFARHLDWERRLFDAEKNVYVLDGENMRHGISKGLGFAAWERSENLRRSIEVAKLFNDAGTIAICAFLAPDADVRAKARETVGAEKFLEIYLKAPLETLRKRDTAGMYAKADRGEIAEFPGVSAPYEEPASPDLTLETDKLSVAQCVDQIMALLERRKVI